ncbi:MAG TPA: GNAT family N-acetyltransferase [Pyrinomonadaceae bacterium]|jgi:GNAT superfamily N-acetyltransferase
MSQDSVKPEAGAPGAPAVSLRPVEAADEPFLLAVYASARAAELAMVPWSDEQRLAFVRMQFAAQTNHYRQHYPAAEHSIIEADGRAVGRVYVGRAPDAITILDVAVLPAERGRGVGTKVVRALCAEAERAGRPVRIYVENFNPSLRLFARLGFEDAEDDGLNRLLVWRPEGARRNAERA